MDRIEELSAFVGTTINYLVVTRLVKKDNRFGYTCKCICGNIRSFVKAADITNKRVISCGCRKSTEARKKLEKSIIGKTFGLLTVQSRLDINSNDGYLHVCKCSCGTVLTVKYNNLTRGKIKSCGCLVSQKQKLLLQDKIIKHSNKRYGYLEVLDITLPKNSKYYLAICYCHGCDKITTVRESILKKDTVSSCGCKRSELLSLAAGGTGIPHELKSLQETIRSSQENKKAIIDSLNATNFSCYLSGIKHRDLEVHHIDSLSSLIKVHGITKDNWKTFSSILFDSTNLVPLEKILHAAFHKLYGYSTTKEQFLEFIELYKSNNIPRKYLK